ncbi:MAG: polyphenol oxidase family protein [Acidimicrobiales bacterium]
MAVPTAGDGAGDGAGGDAGSTAELRHAAGLDVVWPAIAEAGVDALVTTRDGGVSTGPYHSLNLGLHVGDDPASVRENRRRAAAALGAGVDELVFAQQIHGTRAATVTAADAGRGTHEAGNAIAATDTLVTRTPGPVLVTLAADCSPILLVDPGARVLATVHAGWRGAVGGAVAEAVHTMESLGARAATTLAWIGPTVAADTYEVGSEVADAARARLGADAAGVLTPAGDRWHFDVAGANLVQLLAAGVPGHQVHRCRFTTGDGRFFSDRAARPCGRFGLLARLR